MSSKCLLSAERAARLTGVAGRSRSKPGGPIRVVELGLFSRGEIPITDDVEIRRDLVDNGTPAPFEIEPGGRPKSSNTTPVEGDREFADSPVEQR